MVQTLPQLKPQSPELSFGRRCGLWLAAWAVALVLTVPNLKGTPLIWVFPFGLFWVFPSELLRPLGWPSERYVVLFVVGWLPYVVLTATALLTRRRIAYFVIYGILCVLLLLNVAGCHMMLRELKDAH